MKTDHTPSLFSQIPDGLPMPPRIEHPDMPKLPARRPAVILPPRTQLPIPAKLPPAPHNGTATSRAAADDINDEWRKTMCGRVYTAIEQSRVGLTRDELSDKLNMPIQTVCARVADLRKRGLIEEPNNTTRATKNGKQAQVIVAKEEA